LFVLLRVLVDLGGPAKQRGVGLVGLERLALGSGWRRPRAKVVGGLGEVDGHAEAVRFASDEVAEELADLHPVRVVEVVVPLKKPRHAFGQAGEQWNETFASPSVLRLAALVE